MQFSLSKEIEMRCRELEQLLESDVAHDPSLVIQQDKEATLQLLVCFTKVREHCVTNIAVLWLLCACVLFLLSEVPRNGSLLGGRAAEGSCGCTRARCSESRLFSLLLH